MRRLLLPITPSTHHKQSDGLLSRPYLAASPTKPPKSAQSVHHHADKTPFSPPDQASFPQQKPALVFGDGPSCGPQWPGHIRPKICCLEKMESDIWCARVWTGVHNNYSGFPVVSGITSLSGSDLEPLFGQVWSFGINGCHGGY